VLAASSHCAFALTQRSDKKKRPPRGGLSEIQIGCFCQAVAAAAFLRFPRQSRSPAKLRPVTKSGNVVGLGVVGIDPLY
jgi:hypothetical protein